jgi:molybdate transport system substrate-binding protein
VRLAATALVVALALTGCGGGKDERSITVLAAASLTGAFTELAHDFEDAHHVHVTLSFGGSSVLVDQVNQGADADVLATADEETMARATAVGDATVIARNRLAIIVERGNPKQITGLADLERDDVVVVVCAPTVPCGKLALRALAGAQVTPDTVSLEDNVKGVVSKVTLGEADAGIAYVTDVRAAGGAVEGVDVDAPDVEAVYPMAVVRGSAHAGLARDWIAFVAGPDGQRVLRGDGFLAP